jgi:predicted DNA-binding ribbon-helix-helix protein
MKSPIVKRSIVIGGNKTSVSLEDEFWQGLKEIAQGQRTTLSNTVAEIDRCRQKGNLSSAIRLFVLDWARAHSSLGAAKPIEAVNTLVDASQINGGRIETRI